MTLLFDRVLRHRYPNDVQALIPPTYDKFPPFERLDDHREQVRAALWQFGGVVTAAAHYLRVDPLVCVGSSMKSIQACLRTLRASMRR